MSYGVPVCTRCRIEYRQRDWPLSNIVRAICRQVQCLVCGTNRLNPMDGRLRKIVAVAVAVAVTAAARVRTPSIGPTQSSICTMNESSPILVGFSVVRIHMYPSVQTDTPYYIYVSYPVRCLT
jgi:hypothetical protein